jgi:uncharacterized repeat protein (TIGR03847 family)
MSAVRSITVDAIGAPGARVFYLQVQTETGTLVSFLLEKTQAILLAEQIEQLLTDISRRYPVLASEPVENNVPLQTPESVRFRAGKFGLQYEHESDLVELDIREMGATGTPAEAKFFMRRNQAQTLSEHARDVARQGIKN